MVPSHSPYLAPYLAPDLAKPELRAALREARRAYVAAIDAAERLTLEARLAEQLRPLIDSATAVGSYCAVGSEIDPAAALAAAKLVALPSFAPDADSFAFRQGPASAHGPHGIPQPPVEAEEIACDLILVPLLAIDGVGHRLGQGGGHYDRVLPSLRASGARLIGVGWAFQRLTIALPVDPWDVALDGFACPTGVEMFR